MLKPEELREFSQIDPVKSWIFIAFTWALIAATFIAPMLWPNIFVGLLCIILMARHQLSLAILMHDAAHKRLFKKISWNDYIGQFFLAAPVFFSLMAYRNFHLKHHLNPLVPEDPDITLTGGYPIPKASFYRKIFRDISGLSYFKFIKYFISKSRTEKGRAVKQSGERTGPSFSQVVLMIAISNIILFAILFASGHPWFYLLFWFLPMATVLQAFLRIRGVAEHAGYQPNADQRLNSRTIISPLQTFFVAPNNVNYHIEHHVYPSVPWYLLPKVHRIMKERGSLPAANLYSGYGPMLKEILH